MCAVEAGSNCWFESNFTSYKILVFLIMSHVSDLGNSYNTQDCKNHEMLIEKCQHDCYVIEEDPLEDFTDIA